MQKHVHIGAGKIGLAFALYFASNCNLRTTIVNRNSRSPKIEYLAKQKQCTLNYYDGSREILELERVVTYGSKVDTQQEAVRLIADPHTAIVTTAVGLENLCDRDIVSLLAAGVHERATTAPPLFVVACENGTECSARLEDATTSALTAMMSSAHSKTVFLNCIVDQICDNLDTTSGRVVIEAECFREWVIVEDPERRLRQTLSSPGITLIAANQLPAYERRKSWLVNGLQLAAALMAGMGLESREKCIEISDMKLADVIINDGQPSIHGIASDLVGALATWDAKASGENRTTRAFDDAYLTAYAERMIERIKLSPDTCGRVLRKVLFDEETMQHNTRLFADDLVRGTSLMCALADYRRSNTFSFLKKYNERLVEPFNCLWPEKIKEGMGIDLWKILLHVPSFLASQGDSLNAPA